MINDDDTTRKVKLTRLIGLTEKNPNYPDLSLKRGSEE
jgi:hypothetical protein